MVSATCFHSKASKRWVEHSLAWAPARSAQNRRQICGADSVQTRSIVIRENVGKRVDRRIRSGAENVRLLPRTKSTKMILLAPTVDGADSEPTRSAGERPQCILDKKMRFRFVFENSDLFCTNVTSFQNDFEKKRNRIRKSHVL